jgi:hypothetical protein
MIGFVHDLLTRQLIRQLVALWPCPLARRPVFGVALADLFGLAGFQLLELPGQPLRSAAELHPPQLGDLELQLLDLEGAQLDGEPCRLHFRGRRRQLTPAGQGKSPQRVSIGAQIE